MLGFVAGRMTGRRGRVGGQGDKGFGKRGDVFGNRILNGIKMGSIVQSIVVTFDSGQRLGYRG